MDFQLARIKDVNRWDGLLRNELDGHLLQSWEWGQFKERFHWRADYLAWNDPQGKTVAAALVLKRTILSRFSVLYCPRGPSLDWSSEPLRESVLTDLQRYARSEKAIFIKIDPDLALEPDPSLHPEIDPNPIGVQVVEDLRRLGWQPSKEQIQFRNSMYLNLNLSENDLLSRMKSKTRYNIRLAKRRGVVVRKGNEQDLDLLYRMYAVTSLRDAFTVREQDYYQDAWGSFMKSGMALPFIAEVNGEPVAAIILFHFGKRATYMYGMSLDIHREKMPNHLLQWEAIRWAKANGCELYDFWGAPDTFTEDDPMWGVYRFKAGFGADIIRTSGAWDFISRPVFYLIYNVILPKVLSIMRRRGRTQTTQNLEA
jgi:peptidoglycan pentaglycine glycine transferase (the first glycine)